ncbi:MAG: hypothetical protein Q8R36_01565 [bacterium]|nr:hypothetical protein [bacterium]
MNTKSVFVPLNKEAFRDFSKGKTFEVRRAERGWNRNQIYTGRGITLSCGYSGARLSGVIGKVIFGSIRKIFKEVLFKKIEPLAKNCNEAKKINTKLLGIAQEYVAFEIILNGN